jgi:hypothetical protein
MKNRSMALSSTAVMRHSWAAYDRHLLQRASFALLAAFSLAATACGGEDDSGAGTGPASGTAPAGRGAAGAGSGLRIAIDEPADGAEVSGEFAVSMTPSVDVGEPETGLHHIHLYYDGAMGDGEYDMVFADSTTVTRPLEPGEHTIEAVIVNADHTPTDARTTITVNVTGSAAGAGPGAETTLPTMYGY